MTNWQAIETAPRDGTYVLVWDGFGVMLAAYRKFPEFEEWVKATGSQGEARDRLDYADQRADELDGWSAYEPLSGDSLEMLPTHWMPMPDPPGKPASIPPLLDAAKNALGSLEAEFGPHVARVNFGDLYKAIEEAEKKA